MSELPITAFCFKSEDGEVQLLIEEVFGFPNETSYGGGYEARGMFTVKSGGFSAEGLHYFTTGELYAFFEQLKSCYEKQLSGKAILLNTDGELDFSCVFDKFGHVIIKGRFRDRPDRDNTLNFELASDQTQVRDSLLLLETVYRNFGGEGGLK